MKWRTYKWLLRALLRIGVWLGIPVVAVVVNPQAMQTGVMAGGFGAVAGVGVVAHERSGRVRQAESGAAGAIG